MANGTITGSFSGGTDSSKFTYKLIWTSEIYDVATRTSKVTLSWYVVCSASGYPTHKQSAGWSKTVDGTTTSGNANFNYPNPVNLPKNSNFLYRSEVIYVTHGGDGTKTVSISGTINLSGTSAGNGSLSGQMVLDQIAVTPPTVTSLTLTDVGTGYSTVGVYVAGFTTMRLTAYATAGDAPIASYAFYRGDTLIGRAEDMGGWGEVEMAYTEPSGSWVYSVIVTDTAGNSASLALAAVTVYAYTPPTITAQTYRCDSGGNQDNEGTYGRLNMTYSVASVGSNSATVHKVTFNGTDYTTFPQIVSGLATTNTYAAVYVVTDKLGTTSTITQYVQVSFINFDLYPSSNGGVAFGEAAQEDKFIVNQSQAIFRGSLTLGSALGVASGGSGVTSNTNWYKKVITGLVNRTTEYFATDSTTSTSTAMTKTYTVSGSGLLFASVSIKTDNTSNYGSTYAEIQKNSATYAYSLNRFGSAAAYEFGANAVIMTKVATGDVITLSCSSSKNGTKTGYFNVLGIGCTCTIS